MKRKRSYTAVDVEHFDLSSVLPLVTVGCIVAIDVAKTKFVAAIATSTGEVVKLVRFEHPRQTHVFLRMLEGLRDAERTPSIVMEPTGVSEILCNLLRVRWTPERTPPWNRQNRSSSSSSASM